MDVWVKARDLVIAVYRETAGFPQAEQYGLTSQLRRAAVSTAANIDEGAGRRGQADFARFLDMAMGSVAEARSHLHLCQDLGYLHKETAENLSEQMIELARMLNGFIETLRR